MFKRKPHFQIFCSQFPAKITKASSINAKLIFLKGIYHVKQLTNVSIDFVILKGAVFTKDIVLLKYNHLKITQVSFLCARFLNFPQEGETQEPVLHLDISSGGTAVEEQLCLAWSLLELWFFSIGFAVDVSCLQLLMLLC